ncbi:MAG: TetR/AcrR family transcriptional regulator, partial [Pseudodonghicola sp.]
SPEDRLRRVIREVLRAYKGADHEHQVQISALSALPDDQQDRMRAYQRDMVKFMGGCLHDVAPAVFAAHPEKLRGVTMSVYGMLNWYFMWNAQAEAQERDDYADLVCDLTLRGLPGL